MHKKKKERCYKGHLEQYDRVHREQENKFFFQLLKDCWKRYSLGIGVCGKETVFYDTTDICPMSWTQARTEIAYLNPPTPQPQRLIMIDVQLKEFSTPLLPPAMYWFLEQNVALFWSSMQSNFPSLVAFLYQYPRLFLPFTIYNSLALSKWCGEYPLYLAAAQGISPIYVSLNMLYQLPDWSGQFFSQAFSFLRGFLWVCIY